MTAVDIIGTKRDGHALSRQQIDAFIAGVTGGQWTDYQAAALLMAIVIRGMTSEETAQLTDAMVRSGARVDLSSLPGTKVGKHSTGGVGDKVSIVLAPLVAACGVTVPKMSGRGLGHTGGTLDKLEAIPGFRVALSLDEFRAVLGDVGCCMISQTKDIAPADKRLYSLRDVTGTVASLPLIAASVMSKKIAEGSDVVVLDVKCGSGAFMRTRDEATALARSLVTIGKANGVRTEAFITAMDAPLGRAVGNALEIAECIAALNGQGPPDLHEVVETLAARMVQLGGRAENDADGRTRVREALHSGRALEKFAAMVARQGGDDRVVWQPALLPQASQRQQVTALRSGYVQRLDAAAVGRAAVLLGAGRARKEDAIDPAAGIVLFRKPGDEVRAGEPVVELQHNAGDITSALALIQHALVIGDEPPSRGAMVLDHIL